MDRISFNTTATSKQLRQAFLARGYKLPQTVQNVRNVVMIFFQTLKSDTKNMIEIKRGAKNSVLSLLMNIQVQETEDT